MLWTDRCTSDGEREPLGEYKTCYCDTAQAGAPENRWKYPPPPATCGEQDTRNVGDIRLLMLSGRGQVHAAVYFVAGAVKT